MLEAVSIAALLLIGAVLVFAATRPDGFRVARSVRIQAPPERIFPLISDFRRWSAWSPWERKDPGMKRSYGGVPEGRGATYAWQGNGNVGQGRMEITEATPPRRVAIQLDFVKPFEAHNTVLFTLRPEGGSTEVTWEIRGAPTTSPN